MGLEGDITWYIFQAVIVCLHNFIRELFSD